MASIQQREVILIRTKHYPSVRFRNSGVFLFSSLKKGGLHDENNFRFFKDEGSR